MTGVWYRESIFVSLSLYHQNSGKIIFQFPDNCLTFPKQYLTIPGREDVRKSQVILVDWLKIQNNLSSVIFHE